jgi:hypothetical protein
MIPYILHVTVIITACFLFYKLFLQKETFFRLNRWTLLACVVISFTLPLLPVPQQWSWRAGADSPMNLLAGVSTPSLVNTPAPASANTPITPVPAAGNTLIAPSASPLVNIASKAPAKLSAGPSASSSVNVPASAPVSLTIIFYWIYLFGVIVFGANFLLQVITLLYRAYARPVVRDGRFRIVETTGDRAPCSFGNNIFINPSQYDWDTYNQILLHEKIHASGRHTIDLLLAEILVAGQWFNPFAWLYRKEVENNLEFLTDESVLQYHEVERSAYQLSLLKVAAPNVPFSITTNYNQSLLKRRIIMMNSKKSSLHTIWKYFFLLPLLTCLVCALNKPAVFGQSTAAGQSTARGQGKTSDRLVASGATTAPGQPTIAGYPLPADTLGRPDRKEGSWFATSKDDKLYFEFKGEKDEHTWSNNTCILKSEFTSLPGTGKVTFRLVREAGTIFFTGQFDGEQGYGHYSFKPDENYVHRIGQKGITELTDDDLLAFFMINLKNDYVDMLQHNGFPHIGKNNLIAMSAMGIDQSYIQSWREMGYADISENDLIAAKSMGIDKTYIGELRTAGYQHLNMDQLIAFKSQGIDGRYINQLSQAQIRPVAPNTVTTQQAQISKITEVPDYYPHTTVSPDGTVTTSQRAQISKITRDDATSDESISADRRVITAEPFSAGDIVAFKALNIDSAYIASLRAAGYDHLTMNDLISLHSLNIDAAYIKSFQAVGYKDIPAQQLPALKSLGITPEYVKGFRDIGYTDIPLDQLPALKSIGVTPAYVNEMKGKGFVSNDLNKYIQLKNAFQ